MILKLDLKSREEDMMVYFNGKSETLISGVTKKFTCDKIGKYKITIENKTEKPKVKTWIRYMLYLPISLIQTIFCVLMMEDLLGWYKSVNPYNVIATGIINLDCDKEICLKFIKSTYIDKQGTWSTPKLVFEDENIEGLDIKYEKSREDFNEKYFFYFRVLSMLIILNTVLFSMFAIDSFIKQKYGLLAFCIAISVTLSTMLIIKLIKENKRKKELVIGFID